MGVIAIACVAVSALAQSREWVWMGGSKVVGQPAVYGKQGAPAPGNTPGERWGASAWTDSGGNFWLFGGSGIDFAGQQTNLNDLWKYTPSTGEWTWVNGGNQLGAKGNFGSVTVASTANFPSIREFSASWTDKDGNFWLFGGQGEDSAGNSGYLNDLWEYSPSTGQWTWMGGPSTIQCVTAGGETDCGNSGMYGMQNSGSKNNIPGSRANAGTSVDGSGNLWLFGGLGYGSTAGDSYFGTLNDLWEYSPSTGEWT
jgi:N-acetylneuraminic acid mutarotase